MRVLVAGSNGNTGKRIVRLLVAEGHEVRAMVRDEDQMPALEQLGAEPVLADLEGEVGPATDGCDAVIFAAGGGPGSGTEKKEIVDRGGAVKLVEAAEERGVRRYLMLSTMQADAPDEGPEAMQPYLHAKAQADERLQESGLDYTVIRPGRLTDDEAAGTVDAAESLGRYGEVSREDVARTFVAALEEPNTYRKTFELLAGETPIERAVRSV